MIFLYLLIAVLAFLTGWFLGKQRTVKPIYKPVKKGDFGTEENLRKEYENFLNYDGSEQI